MNSSSVASSNFYRDSDHPLPLDGSDFGGGGEEEVYYDAQYNYNTDASSNSYNYNALDDDQYRTDILKLILYDLNSVIAPREARLLAIRTALEEFDHDDEVLHEEELDLRADHILLQKLSYALSIDPCGDEVGLICSALEAVYRASRERLGQSFHEICDALLPVFVEMIRPPPTSRGSRGVEFSLRQQQEQQRESFEKNENVVVDSNAPANHSSNNNDEESVESVNNIISTGTTAFIPPGTGEYTHDGIVVNPTTSSASAETQKMSMDAIVPVSYFVRGNGDGDEHQQAVALRHHNMNMNPDSTMHSVMGDYGSGMTVAGAGAGAGGTNDSIRMDLEDAKQAMLNQISKSLSSSLAAGRKHEDDNIAMALRGGGLEVDEEEGNKSVMDNELNDGTVGTDSFVNDKSELSNDDDSSKFQSEFNDLFCESQGSVSSNSIYEEYGDNPFSDTSSLYDNSTVASSFKYYGGDTTVYSGSNAREFADTQGRRKAGTHHNLSATNKHDIRSDSEVGGYDHGMTGGDYIDYNNFPKMNENVECGSNMGCNSSNERLPQLDEHDRHETVNGATGDYQSHTTASDLGSSSTSRCDSGLEFYDSSAHAYEESNHRKTNYVGEHSNPFGRSDDTDCRGDLYGPSEYTKFEEHLQPPNSAHYTSHIETPMDQLQFDEEKFPFEDGSSNLNLNERNRYDEDIRQFQKPSLSMPSHQHYYNYFDPVIIDVCPVAVLKVLKILRYFSRVLSAMESLAQQLGLVDALLYHMMKKPLPVDRDNETASRVDAIAIVVNLACAEENKQMLVHHPGLLDVVINIANNDPIDEAREHAAIVLMNLAYSDDNKVHLVNRDYLLDSLITLLSDISPFTRRYASATLFTLACTYANTAIMAKHCNGGILEALRKVLINDPIDESRVNAAEALFNMSRNNLDDMAEMMGNHPRLLASLSHSVLTDYSADVRAYSARALEWLSADIHHPMSCHQVLLKALVTSSQWTKTTCIAEALKAQASLSENRISMVEHPGLLDALGNLALLEGVTNEEVRICAISAIERLSTEVSARRIMVKNESVMTALTKATFANDCSPDDALVDGIPTALLTKAALKNLSSYL